MNRLLVFLGIMGIIIGGLFFLNDSGILPNILFITSDLVFNPIILSTVIVGFGFVRFNKIIGIASFLIGGYALINYLDVISWINFPTWFLSLFLLALGARSLLIGILSHENIA